MKNIVNVDKKSTRDGYGDGMVKLGSNIKVVALTADLAPSTKIGQFVKKYPHRFFQCGVAEQNMIAMAAGMALEGLVPFASSFGVFLPMRCLDQIRMSVCFSNANVKLVATHCGLITGEDGSSHQALEDVAALRAMPGMTIIEPCDHDQAVKATVAAAKWKGPVYLRLHRAKFPSLKCNGFKVGKAQVLQEGGRVTIIGSGPVLNEVMKAAERLDFKPEIINCHTIKPLDEKTILKSVRKTKRAIVVQDHQVFGGLGSAVAELLSSKYPVKIKIIGVEDTFGESGSPIELWDKYGFSAKNIEKQVKKIIRR